MFVEASCVSRSLSLSHSMCMCVRVCVCMFGVEEVFLPFCALATEKKAQPIRIDFPFLQTTNTKRGWKWLEKEKEKKDNSGSA